jgi:hypothetical protein
MIATPIKLEDSSFSDGKTVSDEAAPLTFLIGYGRGTPALVSGLERAGHAVRSFDRFGSARAEIGRTRPDLILVGSEHGDRTSIDNGE